MATQIGPDLGGHEEEARSPCKEHRGRGSVIVTVCVSFDPTVSEACDQNQNQNQNVQGLSKFDLWQLFWKGSNKRMNHSVPFTAAVRALSARLWKEILIGLAEAEFVPESAMNLCCTDCTQCHGGS